MNVKDLLTFAAAGWKPSDVREFIKATEEEKATTRVEPEEEPEQTEPEASSDDAPATEDHTAQTSATEPNTGDLLNQIQELQKQLKQAQTMNVENTVKTVEKSAEDILSSYLEDMNGGRKIKKKE